MRGSAGFTMIELVVVVAILGIMAVTAVPLYHTYQQRAYGSEAALMLKRILDAQIMYFLDNDKFFPEAGTKLVFHDDLPTKDEIRDIEEALKLTIPVGHFLDFNITGMPEKTCMVIISSYRNSFDLFKKEGSTSITATVDSTGRINYF